MNKKSQVVKVLIFLVVIVLVSALTLLLVRFGIVTPKEGAEDVSILNAEFVPMGRGGSLAIKQFDFCGYVDERFDCFDVGNSFESGDDIYVRFLVESSVYNGNIMLVRNYRIINPDGMTILRLDEKNNYYFEGTSDEEKESVAFADYFPTTVGLMKGEYTIEVVIENPILEKKVTLSKMFVFEKVEYIGDAS